MLLSSATISLFPDWTIAVQLGVFLLALAMVSRLLLRPLLRVRDLRIEATTGAEAEAKRLGAVAEERLARYEQQVAAGRQAGLARKEQLRQEGYATSARVMAEAKQAAMERLQQTKALIAREAEAARRLLEANADEFARSIVERLLERKVNAAAEQGKARVTTWHREGGKV